MGGWGQPPESSLRRFASAHPRAVVAARARAVRDLLRLRRLGGPRLVPRRRPTTCATPNPVLFVLACVAVAAYYLLFVLGWMRILADWDIHLSYPAALRAEMVSMLAKYVPGGVWTPAARVVAARRAGVTDGALVTASMLLEAGISAVAGVIVFVVSLAWVKGVDAPIAPLVAFGVVVAVLLHPRVFRPLASKVLRRLGYHELPPLRGATMLILLVFYSGTWIVGGTGLWLLAALGRRASERLDDRLPRRRRRGRCDRRRARRSSRRRASARARRRCTALMLAVAGQGAALGATVLNRVAITLVEVLLLVVGGLLLRSRTTTSDALEPVDARG